MVNKFGVKGGTRTCFPVYQIQQFWLYGEFNVGFEITVGCGRDVSFREREI